MKRSPIPSAVLAVAMILAAAVPALAASATPAQGAAAPGAPTPATVASEQLAVPTEPDMPVSRPAPVLVISSYKTSAKRLLAGSTFDLTLDIRNETGRIAENAVVALAGASGGGAVEAAAATGSSGLTILDTGNAKYVGTIRGRTTKSVTFRVVAGPGTPPGAMTIPVSISFEHGNERHESQYSIGLVFERDAAIKVTLAEYPNNALLGEPFDASFEIANTGAFGLSAMSISVESTGATIADSVMFVGAFDTAATEGIDVTVTPENAGPVELTLVVTYRDDFGKEKTFKSAYTVEVEGQSEPDEEADAGDDESAEKGSWFARFFRALFGLES